VSISDPPTYSLYICVYICVYIWSTHPPTYSVYICVYISYPTHPPTYVLCLYLTHTPTYSQSHCSLCSLSLSLSCLFSSWYIIKSTKYGFVQRYFLLFYFVLFTSFSLVCRLFSQILLNNLFWYSVFYLDTFFTILPSRLCMRGFDPTPSLVLICVFVRRVECPPYGDNVYIRGLPHLLWLFKLTVY